MTRRVVTSGTAPTTSDDGRWVVISGRRWRATDPGVDERFRSELVAELMHARRDVRDGRTDLEVAAARRRVHLAKVALGERGEPWWEPTEGGLRERLAAVAVTLARGRGRESSICPSDIARAVGGAGWRALLDPVRDVGRALARAGTLEIVQRGHVLDPDQPWKGPVRIRVAATDPASPSSAASGKTTNSTSVDAPSSRHGVPDATE